MRWTLGLGLVLVACAAGTIDGNTTDGGVAGPGPLDCGRSPAETAAGQCDGTILSFCVNAELRTVDCGVVGAQCGLDPVTQVFACRQQGAPQPDPQPGIEPQPGVDPQPTPPPQPEPSPFPEPEPTPQPEPPSDMPCLGVADGTVCVGATIIICRGEEPAGRTDCSMSGLSCGPVPSGGFGCVSGGGGGQPEPEPEAPMPPGGDGVCVGREGGARCDGNLVVQCRGGREDSRFDCSSNGQRCEIFDNTWAGCVGENQNPNVPNPEPEPRGEPCTIENFFGRCVGNVLEGCNLIEMEVFRLDCTILGATCGQMDGLYGCW